MLDGRVILIVEDEYMIADDLATALRGAGATVIGPAESMPAAVRLLEENGSPDAAILDVNLRGVDVYPLVDLLMAANVPLLFTTGYEAAAFPAQYRHFQHIEKPVDAGRVIASIAQAIGDFEISVDLQ